MKNIKKRYILIPLIIILIVGGFLSLKNKGLAIPVKEVKVQQQVVIKTVSAPGKVKASQSADISLPVTGNITYMGVKEGDTVTAGDYLAKVDDSVIRETVQAYKDARDVALRTRDLFLEQYQNHKSLVGGNTEYEIKLKTLNEQISQADATYQAQIENQSNTAIYAPFSGTVVSINKHLGELATPGTTVMTIAQLNDVYFELNLDQEDFTQLKNDQKAEITLDSYDGYRFPARVYELPLTASDQNNFTIKLKIDPDTERPVLLGMEGDGYITAASTEKPVNTLEFDQIYVDSDDKSYIWIADSKGILTKKYIETGLEGDIYTEIKTPLDPSETIVAPVTSSLKLTEGMKVNIIK